jgi:hypothetical protein
MDRDALDRQLLEAHAKKDGQSLVHLYTQAADQHEAEGDVDAACFFLTQAFVFALEAGTPEARALNMRLAERGRAPVLTF